MPHSVSAAIIATITLFSSVASAQQLNTRTHAPPGVNAEAARMKAFARAEAKRQSGADLLPQTLVRPICAGQVGGAQTNDKTRTSFQMEHGPARTTQNTTIVNGDTILLCN